MGNNSSNCNGSIYPVLPASLLYSQLYSAANQSHSFHTGHNVGGHNPNGELQNVMDQITTSAAGTGLGLGNGIGLGNAVGGLVAGE